MKKTTSRVLALLCVLVMCLSMAACSNGNSGSAPAPSTVAPAPSGDAAASSDGGSDSNDYIKVVIAGASDPGNYLPFNAENSVRDTYSIYFYEPLFRLYDTAKGLTPVLATGYERIEEGVYRVTIHDDIYDYAGEHVTASDVAFCINTVIKNGERTNALGEVQSCEVVNECTVDIVIQPDVLGVFEKCATTIAIVSQKSYEVSKTGFSSDPVGTGPYYIDNWLPGSSITFKKNENYWAKDKGFNNQNCDEIEVKFIAEPAQVAIELETGGVDFAYNLSSKDADAFVDREGFGIVNTVFNQVRCIAFNCDETNVFSNQKLRQAVCYAIDPAAILQGAYDGKGGIATCLAVPEPESGLILDYLPEWKDQLPYPYDVEKAKELMAEAGYPDGGLKVRLISKDMFEYRTTAEIIQAYLAEIGIEVEILCYENALFQTYRYDSTAFDMYLCQIANSNTPYMLCGWKFNLIQNATTGKNIMFQSDDHLQELLETALDIDTRSDEVMSSLHDYIMETAPVYPYCYTETSYVHVDSIVDPFIAQGINFYPNMSTFSNHARHS